MHPTHQHKNIIGLTGIIIVAAIIIGLVMMNLPYGTSVKTGAGGGTDTAAASTGGISGGPVAAPQAQSQSPVF